MTIQEKIYIRFLTSIARLKVGEKGSDKILIETVKKYLEADITSSTNFAIKLMKDELLVKTAIVTALMEASNGWSEFETLFDKQRERIKNFEYPTGEEVDFEAVMKKIMK